jgi:hypothetical protein
MAPHVHPLASGAGFAASGLAFFFLAIIEEDMSQTEQIEPLELESKDYWLRRFRKAKSLKTLELMVPKAVDQYHQQPPVLAAIYLAECQRERELEYGVLLNR